MEINISLATDNNYAKYAGVVIASVLKNSDTDDTYNFYVINNSLDTETKEKLLSLNTIRESNIEFIDIDKSLLKEYENLSTHSHVDIMTYVRLKLTKLLPHVKRVIYLDCDVVVNSDIKELFVIDLKGNPLGGVTDINNSRSNRKMPMLEKGGKHFNAGVYLMDLEKIRELNIETEYLEYAKKYSSQIIYGDQEIINAVMQGKITELPSNWNVQVFNFSSRSDYTNSPKIIHYVGKQKPWQYGSFTYFKDKYYNYLIYTPWSEKNTLKSELKGLYKWFCHKPFFFLCPTFFYAIYRKLRK